MVIYKITNKINGKIYIGKRVLCERDFMNSNYWGSGKFIKRAIAKYGKNNFMREVICECASIEDMNKQEIFYINKFNALVPYGYNIQKGGNGGDTGRRKGDISYIDLSNRMMGNDFRKGLPSWNKGLKKGVDEKMKNCGIVSEERNLAVSRALKGKPKTESHKKKMRGELSSRHKITWEQALEIRRLYLTGNYSQYKIADMFHLCQSTVSSIIKNETWIQYE
jgi:group I intron endonuclease